MDYVNVTSLTRIQVEMSVLTHFSGNLCVADREKLIEKKIRSSGLKGESEGKYGPRRGAFRVGEEG